MKPVLALLCVALLASVCTATTIHVPADQATMQQGINAAVSGDTVLVAAGTYVGALNKDLDFGGKDLVLLSEDGPDVTIIDCGGSGRGFRFHTGESHAAVVSGFTITNGHQPEHVGGGGALCETAAPTFENVVFLGNAASSGGGLYCVSGSDPVVIACRFVDNQANNYHGGGLVCNESAVTIVDCWFSGNMADVKGGAIWASQAVDVTVESSWFLRNSAEGYDQAFGGGAVYCEASPWVDISGSVFSGNSARRGGAIYVNSQSDASVTSCTFCGDAAEWGAALYCRGSSPTVRNAIMAFATQGDAVRCLDGGTPDVSHCCVFGNAGGDSLCGYYHENIFLDPLFCNAEEDSLGLNWLSPCLPSGNPWGELIGALGRECGFEGEYVFVAADGSGEVPDLQSGIDLCEDGDAVVAGPGIYVGPGNRDLDFGGKRITVTSSTGAAETIIDCQLLGRGFRFCTQEDALAVLEGFTIVNAVADTGGGVLCDGSSPRIRHCVVSSCAAGSGGGMAFIRGSSPLLSGCSVDENGAAFGGGLFCDSGSEPRIASTSVTSNRALVAGGGVWVRSSAPLFQGVEVSRNSSEDIGGGICCLANGDASLRECLFDHNASSGDGGAFHCSLSSPLVENVTFFGNSSGGQGGAILSSDSAPYVSGVIIAFSESGGGMWCDGAAQPLVRYTDIYRNVGGDALCGIDVEGNIFQDPLFCDALVGDFSLCANSPCINELAPVGYMGAFDVGCPDCGATEISTPGDEWAETGFDGLRCSPNPSRGSVTLEFFAYDAQEPATLSVFSIGGRLVARILENAPCQGPQAVTWDGTDLAGNRVSSGVYFVRLQVGGETRTRKALLLR